MNFDKESLTKLIALPDGELEKIIKEIAKGAGVDSENLKIGKADLIKIRAFLSVASDDDIAQLLDRSGGKKQ